jgi:hypothetical protein
MRKIDTSKTTAITAHIVDQMRSIRDPYDLMMSCGHVFDVIDVEKHGTTFYKLSGVEESHAEE